MTRFLNLILAVLASLALPSPALAAGYDHVVVIMLENHSRSAITPSAAPFLAGFGAQDTAFRAVTHPSLPNYLALTSGSTQGCGTDRCRVQSLAVPNVFAQLGTDARSLAESMPSNCHLSDARPYVAHHNPAVYYRNAPCATQDVPLGSTPDISAKLTFVVPDNDHNMHDGSVASGDAWVRDLVAQIHATPEWQDDRTAIVVTFDEGAGSDQNIYLAVESNQGSAADISTHASLPDLLAAVETVLGYPVIGPGEAGLLAPLFPVGGTGGLVSDVAVRADAAGATVSFSLAQTAPVRITIRDAQGAVVRSLVGWGYDWAAGSDSAFWGLRSDTGTAVPRGSYTAQVSARRTDGSVDTATAVFTVG